jgi:hypothetical protein
VPSSEMQHFFVTIDDVDHDIEEEVAGLELGMSEPQSITTFFTLSTITARINSKNRIPILNFAKSIIITSYQYVQAAQQMKT